MMIKNSIVNLVQNRGKQYFQAYDDLVLKNWQARCGCFSPGLKQECQTCPFAIEFIQTIQRQIDPDSQLSLAQILPPKLNGFYSETIKKRCVTMFELGYSLTQIKALTGVSNLVRLRHWLKDSGVYKKANDYSKVQKQRCLELYKAGKTIAEIEEETRISGFIISSWVCSSSVSTRPQKTQYSQEQMNLAVEMYVEGKSYSKIKARTGVSTHRVQQLASDLKVQRKKMPLSGRPPVYSQEVKQKCLDLLAQGLSLKQIEELMGVTTSTIQRWEEGEMTRLEARNLKVATNQYICTNLTQKNPLELL